MARGCGAGVVSRQTETQEAQARSPHRRGPRTRTYKHTRTPAHTYPPAVIHTHTHNLACGYPLTLRFPLRTHKTDLPTLIRTHMFKPSVSSSPLCAKSGLAWSTERCPQARLAKSKILSCSACTPWVEKL
ncbi:hypothetical protein AMECASPLE_003532 [Ameca splendens]|uniref:Uncharacterized protein n=1 Tax=Ameca splendens TaxID=208324 RepID=A0ABV0ZKY6_9TELE